MKKKILTSVLIASFVFSCYSTAYGESFAHLECKDGMIDVVGYEVNESENALFVILEFNNTTSESCSPLFQFNIMAYQDGIELDSTYSSYKPEGCKDSDTKIKPGAVLRYSTCYELSGSSAVDIEVEPMFNFDDLKAECSFDLSVDNPSEPTPDYKALYEETKKQLDELQAKYDELVANQ